MVDYANIPLMTALKSKMKWLNNNQKVISENIAHANTPGYRAKEIQKQDFSDLVENLSGKSDASIAKIRAELHEAVRGSGSSSLSGSSYALNEVEGNEENPNGNSVVLEEEMIKMADNQMQFNLASKLYKKNVQLIKAALGKSGGR